jgi:hypothetical protein
MTVIVDRSFNVDCHNNHSTSISVVGAIPLVNTIMLQYKYMKFKQEMKDAGNDTTLRVASIKKMDAFLVDFDKHSKVRTVLSVAFSALSLGILLIPVIATITHQNYISKKVVDCKFATLNKIIEEKKQEIKDRFEVDRAVEENDNKFNLDEIVSHLFEKAKDTPKLQFNIRTKKIEAYALFTNNNLMLNPRYWPEELNLD